MNKTGKILLALVGIGLVVGGTVWALQPSSKDKKAEILRYTSTQLTDPKERADYNAFFAPILEKMSPSEIDTLYKAVQLRLTSHPEPLPLPLDLQAAIDTLAFKYHLGT